jgi:nucleoside-diphosphate-sugar epimerase
MSYNVLTLANELGINRVVMASSVNAIGMGKSHHLHVVQKHRTPSTCLRMVLKLNITTVFSKRPHFDYLPVDEDHPHYPEDAYSISK